MRRINIDTAGIYIDICFLRIDALQFTFPDLPKLNNV